MADKHTDQEYGGESGGPPSDSSAEIAASDGDAAGVLLLDAPRLRRQVEHWLASHRTPAIVVRPDGVVHALGRALAARLHGVPADWVGRPLSTLVADADAAFVASLTDGDEVVERTVEMGGIEARLTGSAIWHEGQRAGSLLLVDLCDEDDASTDGISHAEAVRSRYSVHVTLLKHVAMAANAAETASAALQVAVNEVCAATGWPLGHVYIQDPASGEMVPTDVLYSRGPDFQPFLDVTAATRYAEGTGLPGRVLSAREAVWMAREEGGPRAAVAAQVGIKWGAGFPVMVGDEVAAILEFFSDQVMKDEELLVVMTSVGRQLGRVLARQRAEEALLQKTQDYRGLFENAHDAILIVDGDEGRILAANPSACTLYGMDDSELVGAPLAERVREIDHTLGSLRAAVDSGGKHYFEDVHLRCDGTAMDLEVHASPVRYRGRPAVLTINRDITQRRAAERALRESEERYALAARAAKDGLWDWDLTTGEVYYSPRWWAILAHEPLEGPATTKAWFDLVHPEDAVRLQWELVHHIEGASDYFESEHRLRHADGDYRWVLSRGLAVRDDNGRTYRIAGSLSDITERKKAEHQLVHDALHDGLTGLPSRVLFMDRLTRAIKRYKRHPETQFAVLFLDLDEFKIVNESLGHQAGDQLLVEIGRRIQKSLRSTDTVARLGGDEFAILIEDTAGADDGTRVAEHVHMQLQQPFEIGGREVFATGSIGIALSAGGYDRAEELLRDADTAMYRAKAMGRSRHAVFDKEMHTNALALLDLETALRKAVENEELVLHYQPVVSLKTGKLAGFEALVRWQRADGQLVSPLEFIPLAEGTGLIIPLGAWVLREACLLAARWREQFEEQPVHLCVNISAKQLWRDDFVDNVQGMLDEAGIDPRWIKLELTESLLMERAEAAGEVLSRLRALGVGLCIDDFGTGYSSLSYLQRFPIDTLKIDRSFVSGMARGDSDMMIVRTIISLAHSLGLDLVAEGVETPEQMARLRALGCEYGQGYLFSKPMSVDDAEALIKTFPRW